MTVNRCTEGCIVRCQYNFFANENRIGFSSGYATHYFMKTSHHERAKQSGEAMHVLFLLLLWGNPSRHSWRRSRASLVVLAPKREATLQRCCNQCMASHVQS